MITTLQTIKDRLGLDESDVKDDFAGTTRGETWDIGAYEFQSATPATVHLRTASVETLKIQ